MDIKRKFGVLLAYIHDHVDQNEFNGNSLNRVRKKLMF
jgi:hypothetical protein